MSDDPRKAQLDDLEQEQPAKAPDASAAGSDATPPASAPAPKADDSEARAEELKATCDLIAELERSVSEGQNQLAVLRRKRDDLRRRGIGPALTQAAAHKALVESSLRQRLERAERARRFLELTGGTVPTLLTPAEQAMRRANDPRNKPQG